MEAETGEAGMKVDIYRSEYVMNGGDDALFEAAKKLSKQLGRSVVIDYSGEIMRVDANDSEFSPHDSIEADYL